MWAGGVHHGPLSKYNGFLKKWLDTLLQHVEEIRLDTIPLTVIYSASYTIKVSGLLL